MLTSLEFVLHAGRFALRCSEPFNCKLAGHDEDFAWLGPLRSVVLFVGSAAQPPGAQGGCEKLTPPLICALMAFGSRRRKVSTPPPTVLSRHLKRD